MYSRYMALLTLAAFSVGVLPAADRPAAWDRYVQSWVETGSPVSGGDITRSVANATLSSFHWKVFLSEGSVQAVTHHDLGGPTSKTHPEFSIDIPYWIKPWRNISELYPSGEEGMAEDVQKMSDGWLVAFNRGEFGGRVWWFGDDGIKRHQVSKHQVVQFLSVGKRRFAVEGFTHRGADTGSVVEFRRFENLWGAVNFLSLPGCPSVACVLSDGSLCIITTKGMIRVDLDKKMEGLVREDGWMALHPQSVVEDAKTGKIYVGMDRYVAMFDRKAGEHRFRYLVPNLDVLQ